MKDYIPSHLIAVSEKDFKELIEYITPVAKVRDWLYLKKRGFVIGPNGKLYYNDECTKI